MIVTETTFRPLDRVIVDETRTALYVRPANGRHLVALLLPSERVDRSVIVTGDRLSTRQAITARRRLMAATDLDTARRVATWGEWDHWTGKSSANGMPLETGPIAELELGDRAAFELLG